MFLKGTALEKFKIYKTEIERVEAEKKLIEDCESAERLLDTELSKIYSEQSECVSRGDSLNFEKLEKNAAKIAKKLTFSRLVNESRKKTANISVDPKYLEEFYNAVGEQAMEHLHELTKKCDDAVSQHVIHFVEEIKLCVFLINKFKKNQTDNLDYGIAQLTTIPKMSVIFSLGILPWPNYVMAKNNLENFFIHPSQKITNVDPLNFSKTE